jgi:hypothetical protein
MSIDQESGNFKPGRIQGEKDRFQGKKQALENSSF